MKCPITNGNACGYDEPQIHRLLSSFPNLVCIENVKIATIPHILKEGKGHLIRSFQYTIPLTTDERWTFEQQELQHFVKINPKLTKLSVFVSETSCKSLTLISAILESSKDTLRHLSFSISEMSQNQNKLGIVPMKNLKWITLTERRCWLNLPERLINNNVDPIYFVFQDGASAQNCFPNLYKLRVQGPILEDSIINFFGLQPDHAGSLINSLPKVQVLEIEYFKLSNNHFDNDNSILLSKFFPNLRVLKLKSEDCKRSESSVWAVFPLVEFLQINFHSWHGWDVDYSSSADQFFTGFSSEICLKLRAIPDELPERPNFAGSKFQGNLNSPSIRDLRHLKELKLKFSGRLKYQFVTHVAGMHAFSKMPNTKFIISYDPEFFNNPRGVGSEAIINQTELCFVSIKPYAQISQEKELASESEWEQ